MQDAQGNLESRTTADVVFEKLLGEILSLRIPPGTKLSEAEVARRFSVSRQPVRDAFTRLSNQGLLLVRPQKATEVRGFSIGQIDQVRFVRLAVELEVIRCACAVWDASKASVLKINLEQQREAVRLKQADRFHQLDYLFHELICELGGTRRAFGEIRECKQKIDRLCVLSLTRDSEISTVLEDHVELARALEAKSVKRATDVVRTHLARLNDAIERIHKSHSEYFE